MRFVQILPKPPKFPQNNCRDTIFTTYSDADLRKKTKNKDDKQSENSEEEREDKGAIYIDFDSMLDSLIHDSDLEDDHACSFQVLQRTQ